MKGRKLIFRTKERCKKRKCPIFEGLDRRKFNPRTLDVSPESTDFYPLIDFHYILHFFMDQGGKHVPYISKEDFKRTKKTAKKDNDLQMLLIKQAAGHISSRGPNAHNYIQERTAILAYNLAKEELDKSKSFIEEVNERINRIQNEVHKDDFKVAGRLSEECKTKCPERIPEFQNAMVYANNFLERVNGNLRLRVFACLLSSIPGVNWLQPKQMKIQEKSNRQTYNDNKIHKSLEDLLEDSEIDLTTDDAIARLDKIADNIGYDLSIFEDMRKEWDFFCKAKSAYIYDRRAPHAPAFTYYFTLLKQGRTSYAIARNLVLKYVIDTIKEAKTKYEKIEDESVKQNFRNTFLRDVPLRDLLQKGINALTDMSTSTIPEVVLHDGLDSFAEVYLHYKQRIENKLEIESQTNNTLHNYKEGMNSHNKKFVLSKVTDNQEFKRRMKFDQNYGEQDHPFAAYAFWVNNLVCGGKRQNRMRTLVTNDNFSNWLSIYQEGLLEYVLSRDNMEQNVIIEGINEDLDDAFTTIEFIKETPVYEQLLSEMKARKDMRADLPPPPDAVKSRNFALMREYLAKITDIEQRYDDYITWSRIQTEQHMYEQKVNRLCSKIGIPEEDVINEKARLLVNQELDFVVDHSKEFERIAEYYSDKDTKEYGEFLEDLITAPSKRYQAQQVNAYIDRIESELPFGVVDEKDIEDEDPRPTIKNLVIITGRMRDYRRVIDKHYRVKRLQVVQPSNMSKLIKTGSETLYLLTTNSCSHAAEFAVATQNATLIKASNTGNEAIVNALKAHQRAS